MGPEDPSNRKKYQSSFLGKIVGYCKAIPKMQFLKLGAEGLNS